MPKWLKLLIVAAVALFVVAQLVPKRVSDAAVKAEPPWDSPPCAGRTSSADNDALIKGLTATYGPAVGVVERKRGPGGD